MVAMVSVYMNIASRISNECRKIDGECHSIMNAILSYVMDKGQLPPDICTLYPEYLTSRDTLEDTWGRPYLYSLQPAGRHGFRFRLLSLGADGKAGGEGNNRDELAGSW